MASYHEYMTAAMERAEYERLEEESGGGWYAHIPGFEGLWASGPTVEGTRRELWKALDEWLTMNFLVSQLPPPDIGVTLGVVEKVQE